MTVEYEPLCARNPEADEPISAVDEMLHHLRLAAPLAMIPVVFVTWHSDNVFAFMGHNPTTCAKAATFTILSSLGLPFFFAFEILRKMLQAHSSVDGMAVISMAANVVHITVGYYLTQHTTWGFYGAAVGRSISNVSLIVGTAVYFHLEPTYKTWGLQWQPSLARAHLMEFFRFGLPGMVMFWVEFGSLWLLSFLAAKLPRPYIQTRVNTILCHVLSMMYVVYLGIATASMVRVGNLLGANCPHHAKTIMRLSFVLVAACLIFTIMAASDALLFILPLHALNAFNTNAQGVFRGMGRPGVGALVNFCTVFLVGLPSAAAVGLYWRRDVTGLWEGQTMGATASLVVFAIILQRIQWARLATAAKIRSEA
ncbi:hypothetical protein DYB26_000215 [Aphanomyces astaci]|uniref:Polysaccharide biosynthesis protein C-terminal domain-containing protein n=1 Tax=Aphanomyces astaci TaxID=112090 RepID=A0A397EED1_APHAT|nr:hypothetical protein DYB38_000917 [Aphanomyces astaci]RHZ05233.1 hypothetical protein DYB26_000215 [Aphanomyces astaci]